VSRACTYINLGVSAWADAGRTQQPPHPCLVFRALLILGALAGAMQLLDAGIGLFQHDLRKCAGPLLLAVLQFFVVHLLHISVRITP
jgi:hypothetical protein